MIAHPVVQVRTLVHAETVCINLYTHVCISIGESIVFASTVTPMYDIWCTYLHI